MNLNQQDIQHIAKLSRLEIPEERVEEFCGYFNSLLDYFEKLAKVNTDGVTELCIGTGTVNVWREDEVKLGNLNEEKEKILQNFPRKKGTLLEVPAVFEGRTE